MINELKNDAEERMSKSLDALANAFNKIRTGRAHSSLLNGISVDYYGVDTPLSQAASIVVEDSRTLSVTPWERSLIPDIEKAIMKSDLGLNPQIDGQLIRLPVPELNEERRRELSRVAGQYAESARVAVRNIRRDGMDQIKRAKSDGMSEDDQKFWEETVQELTDTTITTLDKFLESKQEEIMQV